MAKNAALDDLEQLLHAAEREAALIYATTAGRVKRSSHIRGAHGRRRAGDGDSFWQYRNYMPGDSAHQIDWRRSARASGLYVRQQEWETAQNMYFWVDHSPSMAFQSNPAWPMKRDRARLLALALASLFSKAGERVGYLSNQAEPPRAGRFGLRLLAQKLVESNAIGTIPDMKFPHGSHVVIVSDFLDDEVQRQAFFAPLSAQGCNAHLIQVIDPYEMDFPFKGRVRFEGLEGEGAEILERSEELRDSYITRFNAFSTSLKDFATSQGWGVTTHRTDHAPGHCLLSAMLHISQYEGGV